MADKPLSFHGYTGPSAYTVASFIAAFNDACAEAWDDEHRELTRVTLPEGVFPDLASMQNPITRSVVPVFRKPMFTLEYRMKDGPPFACPDCGMRMELHLAVEGGGMPQPGCVLIQNYDCGCGARIVNGKDGPQVTRRGRKFRQVADA